MPQVPYIQTTNELREELLQPRREGLQLSDKVVNAGCCHQSIKQNIYHDICPEKDAGCLLGYIFDDIGSRSGSDLLKFAYTSLPMNEALT